MKLWWWWITFWVTNCRVKFICTSLIFRYLVLLVFRDETDCQTVTFIDCLDKEDFALMLDAALNDPIQEALNLTFADSKAPNDVPIKTWYFWQNLEHVDSDNIGYAVVKLKDGKWIALVGENPDVAVSHNGRIVYLSPKMKPP